MPSWSGEIKCPECGAWQIPLNYCPNCGHSFKVNFIFDSYYCNCKVFMPSSESTLPICRFCGKQRSLATNY